MIRSLNDLNKSNLGEYAKRQVRKYFNGTEDGNRTTDPAPDMERTFFCKPLGTKKNPRFNTPVRIVVRTTRRAQTDNRAVSEKAVVDGLVKAGIFKNDTKRWVKKITVPEPEISEEEKTLIIIEEI